MNFGKASPDFHQWAIDHEIGGTLKRLDTDYLEEPYTAHELVGPLSAQERRPWPALWLPHSRKPLETRFS